MYLRMHNKSKPPNTTLKKRSMSTMDDKNMKLKIRSNHKKAAITTQTLNFKIPTGFKSRYKSYKAQQILHKI